MSSGLEQATEADAVAESQDAEARVAARTDLSADGGARSADGGAAVAAAARGERLGIVSYTNVSPLHWGLVPWSADGRRAEFVHGVPTELNLALLSGDIDLTLISSVEFIRHRHELKALPDFSIATLGPVYSVMLFHWAPWAELQGARIAVTTDSATSVELLRQLLEADGIAAELVPMRSDLDAMLAACDGALLIGDDALIEALARRQIGAAGSMADGSGQPRLDAAASPHVTDLGEAWYRLTRLPFTFAVWASRDVARPSKHLVAAFRAARESGLGHLAEVAEQESRRLGLSTAVVQRYLANFRYHLELPDRDGLVAFARRLEPDLDAAELRYWEL